MKTSTPSAFKTNLEARSPNGEVGRIIHYPMSILIKD